MILGHLLKTLGIRRLNLQYLCGSFFKKVFFVLFSGIRKNFSGHADVWNRLSNSGDSDLEKVGSQLSNLHGQRIHADYRMDKRDVENSKTAQAIVETAKKMIQILDGSRSEPKRNQIISAIKKWEGKTNQ